MTEKNPYKSGSPEWLLFTNIESSELEARAFAGDAERYALKAEAARNRADEFRAVLDRLSISKGL